MRTELFAILPRIVLSSLPDIIRLGTSGEKATLNTRDVCPTNCTAAVLEDDETEKILTTPSKQPVTSQSLTCKC
jgi:hypothetical protein